MCIIINYRGFYFGSMWFFFVGGGLDCQCKVYFKNGVSFRSRDLHFQKNLLLHAVESLLVPCICLHQHADSQYEMVPLKASEEEETVFLSTFEQTDCVCSTIRQRF